MQTGFIYYSAKLLPKDDFSVIFKHKKLVLEQFSLELKEDGFEKKSPFYPFINHVCVYVCVCVCVYVCVCVFVFWNLERV